MDKLDEKILDAVLPGWKYKNQMPTPNFVYKIKIAVKELVEECKPEFISPDQPLGLKYQGRNEAIRDFEQNILKALGEI